MQSVRCAEDEDELEGSQAIGTAKLKRSEIYKKRPIPTPKFPIASISKLLNNKNNNQAPSFSQYETHPTATRTSRGKNPN